MFRLPFNWSRIVFGKLNNGKTMFFRLELLNLSCMELLRPIRFLISIWNESVVRDNWPRLRKKKQFKRLVAG